MNTKTNIHLFYRTLLEQGITSYPIEFYTFLYQTILKQVHLERSIHKKQISKGRKASSNEGDGVQGTSQKPHHMSPKKVCSLFSNQVSLEYGPWAPIVLEQWKITSALDIGKAVFLMVEHGYLTLSGAETLKDFEEASLEHVS
jgi:uncharacterized repeat protein (TIGR04138 family)